MSGETVSKIKLKFGPVEGNKPSGYLAHVENGKKDPPIPDRQKGR